MRPEGGRLFPFEVSVLHDLCPLIGGFTFPDAARWGFEQFYSSTLLKSDLAIAEEVRGHHRNFGRIDLCGYALGHLNGKTHSV